MKCGVTELRGGREGDSKGTVTPTQPGLESGEADSPNQPGSRAGRLTLGHGSWLAAKQIMPARGEAAWSRGEAQASGWVDGNLHPCRI